MIKTVGVVGAGTMGNGIAQVFAQRGFAVRLADADYVVEAIVENAETKRALFSGLDAITRPEVILASNTSSISITLLGAATKRPDKVLGMHFMNPVPLMELVEMIRNQTTTT